MQRYNVFNQIHKALKAMLYDTALCLQQTDFTDDNEGDEAVQKVIGLVQLLEEHAQNEDALILSAIAEYEPSVADVFVLERLSVAHLSKKLNEVITALCIAKGSEVKVTRGKELSLLFTEYLLVNIKRMNKEESVLNVILWRYCSDEELKSIERRVRRSIPAGTHDTLTRWILRGLNKTETVQWLKSVEQLASENAFRNLFTTAQKELPKRKFQQILESLTEGVMLA